MAYDYDLVTIGGGAAGLTGSGIAVNFGAKTLMIEREVLGGDCTWTGCVPSKTLLKSAKIAQHIRNAGHYGLVDQEVELDFGKMMEHLRRIRQEIYEEADDPSIYENMGIEVRIGKARFINPHTIELEHENGTEHISSRYFLVAAGASVFVPPIDGLDSVEYLTNETLFEINTRPDHLAIIGGGPIGTEMSQAFRRFGTEVTVIDEGSRILRKDDEELARMLQQTLEEEGVHYVFNASVKRVSQENGTITVEAEQNGELQSIQADTLLLATGRRANLDDLNLEAAGVNFTKKGITVNDHCRTSQKHIYAVGDITGRYQFTHMSEHMAKIAVTNALLKLPSKIDTEHVPWATYTDPELAHVGAPASQLDEQGTAYDVYRFPYSKVDRALTESEATGLIKVYAKRLTGKILGADVLGASAGELISEYAVAMRNGVTLREIADTIHPYPSYGLAARRAADQWYYRKQSATMVKWIQRIFGYRGPVNDYEEGRIV